MKGAAWTIDYESLGIEAAQHYDVVAMRVSDTL